MSGSLTKIDVVLPARQPSSLARRSPTPLRLAPNDETFSDRADRIVLRPTEGLVSNRAFTLPGSTRAIQAYQRSMDSKAGADPLFIDVYA